MFLYRSAFVDPLADHMAESLSARDVYLARWGKTLLPWLRLAPVQLPDLPEDRQPAAQGGYLGLRKPPAQLLVHRSRGGEDRVSSRAALTGKSERHPAPVLRVDVAGDIATQYQRVDQLAEGLLADAESADDLLGRLRSVGQAGAQDGAVTGKVLEPARGELRAGGLAVAPASRPHQFRDGGHAETVIL